MADAGSGPSGLVAWVGEDDRQRPVRLYDLQTRMLGKPPDIDQSATLTERLALGLGDRDGFAMVLVQGR